MISGKSAEAGLFRAYPRAGGPTEAGSSAFRGRGPPRIRSRRLGGIVMRLMSVLRSTSLTFLLLRYSSFVGVSSQLLTS